MRKQPVQACHADIGDQVAAAPNTAGSDHRLFATGRSEVPAVTTATVPRGGGSGPSTTVWPISSTSAAGNSLPAGGPGLLAAAGRHDRAARMRGRQFAERRHRLRRGLVRAKNHFGIASAAQPVSVQPGEPDVARGSG